MSDVDVRALERAWRASGRVDDQARWLAARVRAGELSTERLRAAAWAGAPGAVAVVGPVAGPGDPWSEALGYAADVHIAWLRDVATAFGAGVLLDAARAMIDALRPAPDADDERGALQAARAALARLGAQASLVPADLFALLEQLLILGPSPTTIVREVHQALARLDPLASALPLPSRRELERQLVASLPPPSRGWLGRLVLGERAPPHIARYDSLPPGRALAAHRLLHAFCEGVGELFTHRMLPSMITHGWVATDGQRAWVLDARHPQHLAQVLAGEPDGGTQLPPRDLAELAATALLEEQNRFHHVIDRPEELETWARGGWAGAYVLDRARFATYRQRLAPAEVERDGGGLRLRFSTLSGWMHETQTLTAYTARIGPAGRVGVEAEVLCDRVFSETPLLRY